MRGLRRLLSAGLVSLCVLVGALVFGGVPALAVTKHVFSSSFGSFTGPVGLGVDRVSGNVYVADAEGLAVDRFNGTGEALSPAQMSGVSLGEPYGLAVDNSGGITQGDVYVADIANGVVDKFNGAGEYLSQIAGLTQPTGVAVDGEGNVYVAEYGSGQVDKFDALGVADPGNPIVTVASPPVPEIAVDGEGHIFAATGAGTVEYSSTGACVREGCEALDPNGHSGVAVDASNDVFVSDGASIAEFSPAGTLTGIPTEQFGSGSLSEAYGLGAQGSSVYVVDYPAKVADIFTALEFAEPVTGAASNLTASTATLHGTVNPAGLEASCAFEYGTGEEYGQSVPCTQGIPAGGEPVAVEAELAGLEPNQTYHYRLNATNSNGTNQGQDQTFTTQVIPPTVTGTSVSDVASTSATLGAQINPNGSDTTYYFQYGTTASYGTNTATPPGVDIGSGREAQSVSAHVQGLKPDTLYHYRAIAIDSAGTTEGPDRTLTTTSTGAPFALPDNRAYELVTPANKGGADTQPEGFSSEFLPSQSSVSGEEIAYVGRDAFPIAGATASLSQNDYLSTRTAGGWSTQAIEPQQFNEHTNFSIASGDFLDFSPDLSKAVVGVVNSPVVSGAPPEQRNVYLRDNVSGAYRLLTHTPSANGSSPVEIGGTSADFSHVVFGSQQDLTPETTSLPSYEYKLYEWDGSSLRLVSVLPDGTPLRGWLGSQGGYVSHAVSADGSRIFWRENAAFSPLYVRENGSRTVQISSGYAEFEGANSDGSMVIFVEAGELYEYDVDTGQRTALAGASAGNNDSSVIGASDDLSSIYFKNGEGLLVLLRHDGGSWTTTRIAELSLADRNDWGNEHSPGNLGLNGRSAEVSPDGRYAVFMSVNSLTGYENAGQSEVYLYDAPAGRLTCVSCNPNGVPPTGPSKIPLGYRNLYQARYLSSDGSLVFFDSVDALVPGDGNGLKDVYEWERDGTGSCRTAAGCVYLLSGARSGFEATFADASTNGNDVFFKTRAQLVAGDRDQNVDMYDARVGGGFPEPPVARVCAGSGCRAPVSSLPVLGSPLSASFAGVGNTTAASTLGVKAKPKPKHRLKAKKKRKKKRKGKGRRARRARSTARLGVGGSLSGARTRRSS